MEEAAHNVTKPPEVGGVSLQTKLEEQGVNFAIPPRFKDITNLPTGLNKDTKTGLIIDDEKELRTFLASKLTAAIREGKDWAIIYSDADNLKKANTEYGRELGDMVIKYGAARITQAVEKTNLSSDAEVIAARQTHAGDEVVTWCFNVTEEEIKRLKEVIRESEEGVRVADPNFTFSTTATVISSTDVQGEASMEETRLWLTEDSDRIAYEFYQGIVNRADNDVKLLKTAKDLARLPEGEIATADGIKKFMEIIIGNLGNSRMGDELLEVIMKLTSVVAVKSLGKNTKFNKMFRKILAKFGVDEKALTEARTPDALMRLYSSIFGKE